MLVKDPEKDGLKLGITLGYSWLLLLGITLYRYYKLVSTVPTLHEFFCTGRISFITSGIARYPD
jgi:hypothetical protein